MTPTLPPYPQVEAQRLTPEEAATVRIELELILLSLQKITNTLSVGDRDRALADAAPIGDLTAWFRAVQSDFEGDIEALFATAAAIDAGGGRDGSIFGFGFIRRPER